MKALRFTRRSLSARDSEGASSWNIAGTESSYMSGGDGLADVPSRVTGGLDAHADARALVRLIQCSQCSLPLRVPVTLPCGHSVCRVCLPQPHRRAHVIHPSTPDRIQGTTCPIEGCGQEHPLGDCNIDVCMLKVMEAIDMVVAGYVLPSEGSLRLVEVWDSASPYPPSRTPREYFSAGSRLLATYGMAAAGKLDFRAAVAYSDDSGAETEDRAEDVGLLDTLRETAHKELDCQVCYNLMHDPVTAPCGHTFCRICLARVLDHSMHCPMCRRNLPIPPSLRQQPSNLRLVSLLQALCPEMVEARAAAIAADESGGIGELDTPLFVCTLAFPTQPTFLHIFEPRYRLMIRRAYESNRQFGMMMYNQGGQNQGDLGAVNFKEYGVMLQILNVHMFPDGRSLIETRGMYRFRVLAHGTLDGYTVGRVVRVEDVGLNEEERLEAAEIAAASPNGVNPFTNLDAHTAMARHAENSDRPVNLNCLTTQQLLTLCLDFITKMQAHSAPWLHQRILQSHGGPPNDPAVFPYWFAAIIPIIDEEKYQLLLTSSIRERLKIVVGWIRRIENQRWYSGGSCSIL